MTRPYRQLRRHAVVLVGAVSTAALLFAGCGSGNKNGSSTNDTSATTISAPGTTTGAPTGSFASAAGHYVGQGEQGSVTIAFDAGSSSVTGLGGEVLLGCTTGYNLTPFSIGSTIPVQSDGSFSSQETIDVSNSETAVVAVQGKLDGSGNASGTVSYTLPGVCDSGSHPIQWTASIGGSTTPTTSAGSSCSPQPCGNDGGVTLTVTGLIGYPPSAPPGNTLLEMTFTVTNGSTQDLLVTNSLYKIEPGSGQSIDNEGATGYLGTLPDGHTCGDNAADLQPGAHSDPLVACFSLSSDQLAQPLSLIWGYGLGAQNVGGTIDLSPLSVQTGSSL